VEEGHEKSQERMDMEGSIAESVRADIKKGKLKDSHMKKFLSSLYTGDPDCKDCKGCSKEELTECYISAQCNLIDDEGVKHNMAEYYEVDGRDYCCGQELKPLEDTHICEICGTEYNIEE
jgi:hypothetical protein